MGRAPIGKKAMSAAERQRRRRKRLKREKSAAAMKVERARRREEKAQNYVPMPPGVLYWRRERAQREDGTWMEGFTPHMRPPGGLRDPARR